jgi:transcriptional regulator with XRE-family HTH domain
MMLRDVIGSALRHERVTQNRPLRTIARDAHIALGYLSELERGIKDPSSEVIDRWCGALNVPLSNLLRVVADDIDTLAGVNCGKEVR